MRKLAVITIILLIAGSALAERLPGGSNHLEITHLSATESPTNRESYILSYDFSTGPIDYFFEGISFGDQGLQPAGSALIAFGYENLIVDIYHNQGAVNPNWALDFYLGFSIQGPDGVVYMGVHPFFGVEEGPGTFGPTSTHLDLNPEYYPLPIIDPFTFFSVSSFDDGTNLSAGTITSGVVYVWVEGGAVANDGITMGAIKALFR